MRRNCRSITVLVICRQRDVARHLASLLGTGYAIKWAVPGVDALLALQSRRWSAVVIDAHGPGGRATSLVQTVCAHPGLAGAPVLAMGHEQDRRSVLDAGASSFAADCLDVAELAARVRNLVQLCRFRQGQNARRRFSPTFRIWPDPALVIDPDNGRVLAANDAAAETLRLSGPLAALCLPRTLGDETATPRREAVTCRTVSLPGAAGSMLTVETLSTAIRWGRRPACIHIVRELGAPRRAASGDLSEYERLRATVESMSGLAHDFGGVLMAVQAGMDLIASELSPESLRILGIVQESIESASELARRVSRLAKGGDCADAQAIPLGDLVARLRPRMQHTLRAVSLDVIDRSEGAEVWADRCHIEQILLNLVSNAGRACRMHGTVTIHVWRAPAAVCLSVTDTGAGMPPDVMDKLFEPYFTMRSDGTGLGLAIVRHLVTEQGGQIHATSREGRGMTFSIEWPRHAPAVPTPVPSPPMRVSVAPFLTEVGA